jgi:hypothetical protein
MMIFELNESWDSGEPLMRFEDSWAMEQAYKLLIDCYPIGGECDNFLPVCAGHYENGILFLQRLR